MGTVLTMLKERGHVKSRGEPQRNPDVLENPQQHEGAAHALRLNTEPCSAELSCERKNVMSSAKITACMNSNVKTLLALNGLQVAQTLC